MNVSFPNTQYQVQFPSQGIRSQVKTDFQDLSSALQTGDLKSAQNSFADLQKLLQSSGSIGAASTANSTQSASPATNPILSDFQALGQALSSGDLTGAQKDFSQLETDATQQANSPAATGQVAGHRHHHHHAPPVEPPNPLATTSQTSGNPASIAPQTSQNITLAA
jgi:hypothetical protein